MTELPYKEGTVFSVPLKCGRKAWGVVARSAGGGVLCCYFFQSDPNSKVPQCKPNPENAVAAFRVGDLYLLNGRWDIVGVINPWKRKQWPIPFFIRRDILRPIAWEVDYGDNPNSIPQERRISLSADLPEDGLYGAGAAETYLGRILCRKVEDDKR